MNADSTATPMQSQAPQHAPRCALELEVRDYECDHQGIVNHSVYLNYLEHARHKAFEQYFQIPALSAQGIYLVVAEIQIRYLCALRPQDRFTVYSSFALQGRFRLNFEQSIAETANRAGKNILPQNEDVLRAQVCVAAVENGRPCPFSKVSQICGYSF